MKKSTIRCMAGSLSFLLWAAIGFAQPSVTFNPPGGTTVKPGTRITVTIDNYDYAEGYYNWKTGTSVEAIGEITFGDKNQTQTIIISKEEPAVKVALVNEDFDLDPDLVFTATYIVDENAGDIEKPKADLPLFEPGTSAVLEGTKIRIRPVNETWIAVGQTKPETGYVLNDNVGDQAVSILTITENKTIWAFTRKDGYSNSDTVSATYVLKSGAPTFTPAASSLESGETVTIKAAEGVTDAKIFYATGEDKSARYTEYAGPIVITQDTTIRAYVVENGKVSSDTVSAAYTVTDLTPANPDKATIRLVVDGTNVPYRDRNQYQILLDSAHMLVDTYKDDIEGYTIDQSLLPRLYAAADATLPAGLSAENMATGVDIDQQDSIVVEPGVYDMLLFQSYHMSWLEKDALRAVYDGEGTGKYFYLDNLSLMAGKTYIVRVTFDAYGAHAVFSAFTDLQLVEVSGESKPSCELDESAVSLSIANVGINDVKRYDVYYTTGNNDTVTETVDETLAAGTSTLYTFRQRLALEEGKATIVQAGILLPDDDMLSNNTGRYTAFRGKTSTLPARIETGSMHSAKANDWTLDEKGALVASKNASTPVFSTCFQVESAGTYRLSYENICGRFVQDPSGTIYVNNVDVYKIRAGKTSEDWGTWPVIMADSAIVGSSNHDEFDIKEIKFDIAEPGRYAFCIYAERVNDEDNLKFRNLHVEKMESSAARLNGFRLHSPRIVPQDWAEATWQAAVNIENRGLEKLEDAALVVSVNGREAMRRAFSLDIDAKEDFVLDVPVSGFKANDTIRVTGEVFAGETSISKAQAVPAAVIVSKDVAAFDHLTDFTDMETLQGYVGGKIGLIFPVVMKDTLTAVSCAWGAMDENMDVIIAIHQVTVDNGIVSLGKTIYEKTERRGVAGGMAVYNTPAFLLEPGNYFISVEPGSAKNFKLAMDLNPEGGFHVLDVLEGSWKYMTQAGYPVIRALFGSDGKPTSKDAEISAITKPVAGGVFSDNETILVSVRNKGIETVEIPVHVRVDNMLLEPKSVTLEPYASANVAFTADLAAKDEERKIEITAFSSLAGDENQDNDTVRKKVVSFIPADPYRMDFESCLDFATEGLNPVWTSVSLDKTPVLPLRHVLDGAFHYVDFPGSETDLGFIAFNHVTTEPSMLFYEFYDNCRPHSGQRFGVSLGINDADISRNDWLISPKLKMPSKNTQLSMWVRSFDKAFKETYEIWVSEKSGDPESEDFELVYPDGDEPLVAPGENWENVVFDLGRFNGKEVHVAIRCVTIDAPMFMIDDIVIGENADNESTQSADFRLSVWPNPAKEMVMILSPAAKIKQVSLFNLNGSLIHQSADGLDTDNYRYDVSGLVSGIYLARITTDKGTAIRKFIVH